MGEERGLRPRQWRMNTSVVSRQSETESSNERLRSTAPSAFPAGHPPAAGECFNYILPFCSGNIISLACACAYSPPLIYRTILSENTRSSGVHNLRGKKGKEGVGCVTASIATADSDAARSTRFDPLAQRLFLHSYMSSYHPSDVRATHS